MSQKLVHIRASVNFFGLAPQGLIVLARRVHDSMPDNPLYAGAPIGVSTLAAGIDGYIAAVAEATDSNKAVAIRERRRLALVRLLRQLAHFVEVACQDDMAVFMTSGFQPAVYTRTAPLPLPAASILRVEQGKTGQLLVRPKALAKARLDEVRCAPTSSAAIPPTSWATEAIPTARKPAVLNDLTPGVTYTIQVRAFGMLGYTGWSDPVTRMVI